MWYTPIIPVLEKAEAEGLHVQDQSQLYMESEAGLDHIRSCLKSRKKERKKRRKKKKEQKKQLFHAP